MLSKIANLYQVCCGILGRMTRVAVSIRGQKDVSRAQESTLHILLVQGGVLESHYIKQMMYLQKDLGVIVLR